MSRTPDNPPDPTAKPDGPRCDTQTLDLGAVRAIYRAGHTAANDPPSDDAHDTHVDAAAGVTAVLGSMRVPVDTLPGIGPFHLEPEAESQDPAPTVTEVDAARGHWLTKRGKRVELTPEQTAMARAMFETATEQERERKRTALASSQLPKSDPPPPAKRVPKRSPKRSPRSQPPPPTPSPTTLEIDYSPESRLARLRTAKVQRLARGAIALCGTAAVVIALWAWLRAGRDAPPLAAHQIPSIATIATVPEAHSTAAAPMSSALSPDPSTIPMAPPAASPNPPDASGARKTAPPPRSPAAATGNPTAAPSSTAPPPDAGAAPTSAPPVTVPPPPGGTVNIPIFD